ncbi:MAG: SCO family protein, partial [Thermoanaerobaculia bacterium]
RDARRPMAVATLIAAAIVLLAPSLFAQAGRNAIPQANGDTGVAASTPAKLPGKVSIAQNLNSQVPLELIFRDETGKMVRLGDYFGKGRPVLLNFVYYRCPMLCPMVLEGTTTALTQLKFTIGKEFDVVTVSIDPRDRAVDAAEKKEKYVKHYGRLDGATGWHFLTGNDTSIHRLADAVGFQYSYDGRTDQFAHGAALLVLTPDGRTSRYFYGFEYKPRDLRLAIVEASEGKIGTATDQFLLMCFHYDASSGKYTENAMFFVRVGGVTTLLALVGFLVFLTRGHRQKLTPQDHE